MAGEKRYTQIPPRSTGDRMYMVHTAELEFYQKLDAQGGDTDHSWKTGSRYDISGFLGGDVHVHGVYDKGDGTGILAVHYNKSAKYENAVPELDSWISFNGTNIARVKDAYDVYIPAQNIMGYDNPEYGMDVDITGSANVRFAEGLPQLDAWGKLRVAGGTHIGSYVFGQQEKYTENFSTTAVNGGFGRYSNNRNSIQVGIVGSGDPDYVANTGFAASSSNTYHHYIPGSSHLYMAAVRSNSGIGVSTGTIKRWGIFDANNGFFFQLAADGTFSVVIRSSIAEAAQKDLVIPQSDWNGDKADGSGDSQATLDVTKDNIWWIDVQWHGAGRVRFGTYLDGQRVVMHSYIHANNYEYAMSQTASLPTCFAVAAVSGPSTEQYLEAWSASMWTESDIDLNEKGNPKTWASNHNLVAQGKGYADTGWQYLFSLSPVPALSNTETNHSLYQPTSISAYAFDSDATNGIDAVMDIKGEINCVHSGHNFSTITGTTVDLSTAGTSYEFGQVRLEEMFAGRYEAELTDTYNNFQYGALKNLSDDGGTFVNNVGSITQANPAVVTVKLGERMEAREPEAQGGVTFPINVNEYNGKFEFYNMPAGWTSLEGNYYYLKPIAYNQAEVYAGYDDVTKTFNTPLDTSAFAAFTSNTGYFKGFRGSRVIWSFFGKTRKSLHPNGARLMVTINWKEIVQ